MEDYSSCKMGGRGKSLAEESINRRNTLILTTEDIQKIFFFFGREV